MEAAFLTREFMENLKVTRKEKCRFRATIGRNWKWEIEWESGRREKIGSEEDGKVLNLEAEVQFAEAKGGRVEIWDIRGWGKVARADNPSSLGLEGAGADIPDLLRGMAVVISSGPLLIKEIGREMVERGMAGCVQFIPISSVYSWKGEVQEDEELLMIAKTVSREKAVEFILERHPYDVPEVIWLDASANLGYLAWLHSLQKSAP